jgi:hypothetical protein
VAQTFFSIGLAAQSALEVDPTVSGRRRTLFARFFRSCRRFRSTKSG